MTFYTTEYTILSCYDDQWTKNKILDEKWPKMNYSVKQLNYANFAPLPPPSTGAPPLCANGLKWLFTAQNTLYYHVMMIKAQKTEFYILIFEE